MLVFVLYAVGVWYAAARYRRSVAAFVWVFAGFVGLLLVAYLHYLLNIWTQGKIQLPVMQSLLYPYTILVVGVGLYIACLPRARVHCRRCQHDLTDQSRAHHGRAHACPNCGLVPTVAAHGHRCGVCRYDLSGQDEDRGICPECGVRYAHRRVARAHRAAAPPEPAQTAATTPSAESPTPEAKAAARERLLRDLSAQSSSSSR